MMFIPCLLGLFFLNFSVEARPQPLQVVTSFTLLKDFVEQVGGDLVQVQSLVAPDEDPHVYEPTPETSKKILWAEIVFFNGLGFETWMSRLVEASGYQGPLITSTKGIVPRLVHDPNLKGKEAVPDPHAWNSVLNAKIYVKNICEALSQHDPDHQEIYQHKAQIYLKKLDLLESWVRQKFSLVPKGKREIITAHDAFGYYGETYGVTFLAPVGLSTDAEASAWEVAKLVDQIRARNIKTLFVENIANTKLIRQLSEETGAQVGGTLYADSLSDPTGPAPTYEEMMRHNTRLIAQAIKLNGS